MPSAARCASGSGCWTWSSFAKYDVTGTGAEAYLKHDHREPHAETDRAGIVLAHYLSPEGRIAGESTITRLAADRFLRAVRRRG